MAGTFDGLSDLEWKLVAELFPLAPTTRGRGMPHTPFRKVVNTLLYVLITGCRWGDLPRGPQWASKSAAHRWLQPWPADGTHKARRWGRAGPGSPAAGCPARPYGHTGQTAQTTQGAGSG
jgi:transposase